MRPETDMAGYQVRVPMLDDDAGAGGGSITWIDTGGGLRVGPQSTGADPGQPAGRGGTEAAVTDASIVLGLRPRLLHWRRHAAQLGVVTA